MLGMFVLLGSMVMIHIGRKKAERGETVTQAMNIWQRKIREDFQAGLKLEKEKEVKTTPPTNS